MFFQPFAFAAMYENRLHYIQVIQQVNCMHANVISITDHKEILDVVGQQRLVGQSGAFKKFSNERKLSNVLQVFLKKIVSENPLGI